MSLQHHQLKLSFGPAHLSFLAVPSVQWFLILIPLHSGTVPKSNTYDVWDLKCRLKIKSTPTSLQEPATFLCPSAR